MVSAALLALGACADREGNGSQYPGTEPSEGMYEAGPSQAEPMEQQEPGRMQEEPEQMEPGMRTEEPEPRMGEQALRPGEVIGAAMTFDQGEVAINMMGQERAQSDTVREFAGKMVEDHQRSLDGFRRVSMRQNIAPIGGPIAEQLQQKILEARQRYMEASDEDFDRVFARSTVEVHEMALRTIDERLMPAAGGDEELRRQLQQQRGIVQSHLERAREILVRLEPQARR